MHPTEYPLVSVVMPVYNTADYLRSSITSILEQSYENFEFLIFNDGSTDNSAAIISSFTDARIKFYNYPINTGYVIHLNEGINAAKGKYIARMDADDVAYPERLKTQVAYMEANTAVGICGSQVRYIGNYIGESVMPTTYDEIAIALIAQCPIWHPTVMIRKSVLMKNKLLYNCRFLFTEDYDLWCRSISVTTIVNLQEVLLDYRKHAQQVSITKLSSQIESTNIIGNHYLASLGFNLSITHINGLGYLRKNLWQYPINSNASEYGSIVNALNEIKIQNHQIQVFAADKLDLQFESYWDKLTNGIPLFDPRYIIPLVLMNKKFTKNKNIISSILFIFKSLIFWRTRI